MDQEGKVHREQLVHLVHKVLRDLLDFLVVQVALDNKERLEHLASWAQVDSQVGPVDLGLLELQVHPEDLVPEDNKVSLEVLVFQELLDCLVLQVPVDFPDLLDSQEVLVLQDSKEILDWPDSPAHKEQLVGIFTGPSFILIQLVNDSGAQSSLLIFSYSTSQVNLDSKVQLDLLALLVAQDLEVSVVVPEDLVHRVRLVHLVALDFLVPLVESVDQDSLEVRDILEPLEHQDLGVKQPLF